MQHGKHHIQALGNASLSAYTKHCNGNGFQNCVANMLVGMSQLFVYGCTAKCCHRSFYFIDGLGSTDHTIELSQTQAKLPDNKNGQQVVGSQDGTEVRSCFRRPATYVLLLMCNSCFEVGEHAWVSMHLRWALTPAVSSGLACKLAKSYNGAASKHASMTDMVVITEVPACVCVSLHRYIVGRANGSGSISDTPIAPSKAQNPSKGMTNPNMIASDAARPST